MSNNGIKRYTSEQYVDEQIAAEVTARNEALETIASGKAEKTHTHIVSDIPDLQTHLDSVLTEKLDPIKDTIANIPTIQLITWEADD